MDRNWERLISELRDFSVPPMSVFWEKVSDPLEKCADPELSEATRKPAARKVLHLFRAMLAMLGDDPRAPELVESFHSISRLIYRPGAFSSWADLTLRSVTPKEIGLVGKAARELCASGGAVTAEDEEEIAAAEGGRAPEGKGLAPAPGGDTSYSAPGPSCVEVVAAAQMYGRMSCGALAQETPGSAERVKWLAGEFSKLAKRRNRK